MTTMTLQLVRALDGATRDIEIEIIGPGRFRFLHDMAIFEGDVVGPPERAPEPAPEPTSGGN